MTIEPRWTRVSRRAFSVVALLVLVSGCAGAPQSASPAPGLSPWDWAPTAVQLAQLEAAIEPLHDPDSAVANGFYFPGGRIEHPLMGEHWYRTDRMEGPFELLAPPSLQYVRLKGERVLAGVSYTVYLDADEPSPEGFEGPWDEWHRHENHAPRSMARRLALGDTPPGPMVTRDQVAMVHAWTEIPNPDGPFAAVHRGLPYLRVGLDASLADAETADLAAAWGIALLRQPTCRFLENQLARRVYLDDATRSTLRTACSRAHGSLSETVSALNRTDPAGINRAASEAWRAFDLEVMGALSGEQRRQLDRLGHVDRLDVPFGQPSEPEGNNAASRRP